MSSAYKHFELSEFTCKCGCGKNNISDILVRKLDRVREKAGIPILISSGYRCESNNVAAGGAPDSAHLYGLAADITVYSSNARWTLLSSIFTTGFNRIGIGKTFIHVDIDDSKPPKVVWLY